MSASGHQRRFRPAAACPVYPSNPNNPTMAQQTKDMERATKTLGLRLDLVSASSQSEFDDVFATLVRQRTDALVPSADGLFISHRARLIALAERHALPAIYQARDFAAAGGLASYGSSFPHSFRQAGGYVGRILKGEKPSDLPVQQPAKFELVINLTTAKALGLEVPPTLRATADEVLE
jgi:putative tryptophan/tyrosine transport system substrate-binding protein